MRGDGLGGQAGAPMDINRRPARPSQRAFGPHPGFVASDRGALRHPPGQEDRAEASGRSEDLARRPRLPPLPGAHLHPVLRLGVQTPDLGHDQRLVGRTSHQAAASRLQPLYGRPGIRVACAASGLSDGKQRVENRNQPNGQRRSDKRQAPANMRHPHGHQNDDGAAEDACKNGESRAIDGQRDNQGHEHEVERSGPARTGHSAPPGRAVQERRKRQGRGHCQLIAEGGRVGGEAGQAPRPP